MASAKRKTPLAVKGSVPPLPPSRHRSRSRPRHARPETPVERTACTPPYPRSASSKSGTGGTSAQRFKVQPTPTSIMRIWPLGSPAREQQGTRLGDARSGGLMDNLQAWEVVRLYTCAQGCRPSSNRIKHRMTSSQLPLSPLHSSFVEPGNSTHRRPNNTNSTILCMQKKKGKRKKERGKRGGSATGDF